MIDEKKIRIADIAEKCSEQLLGCMENTLLQFPNMELSAREFDFLHLTSLSMFIKKSLIKAEVFMTEKNMTESGIFHHHEQMKRLMTITIAMLSLYDDEIKNKGTTH